MASAKTDILRCKKTTSSQEFMLQGRVIISLVVRHLRPKELI